MKYMQTIIISPQNVKHSEKFYEILKEGKNREVYHRASVYIAAISKLDDGKTLVNKIIANLKISDYQKCLALFDEIKKVI